MRHKHDPKIGIALGSGGAKGLAHIGVLKAFEKHGIPVDYIAGASIGALIGAYYAAYPTTEKLDELAPRFDKQKSYMLFDPSFSGGFIKGKKVENLIADVLAGAEFDSLKIPFAAIATNFNTAEEIAIKKGNLLKALRASISVPAIFQPVMYDKRLLADGGLSDPVPTEVVRDMGSDIVIAVDLYSNYFDDREIKAPPLRKIPVHSINILRHNLTLQSLKTADILVSPLVPQMGFVGWDYFFNLEKAQEIITAGEHAAEKVIPELKLLIQKKRRERTAIRRFFSFFKVLRR